MPSKPVKWPQQNGRRLAQHCSTEGVASKRGCRAKDWQANTCQLRRELRHRLMAQHSRTSARLSELRRDHAELGRQMDQGGEAAEVRRLIARIQPHFDAAALSLKELTHRIHTHAAP